MIVNNADRSFPHIVAQDGNAVAGFVMQMDAARYLKWCEETFPNCNFEYVKNSKH